MPDPDCGGGGGGAGAVADEDPDRDSTMPSVVAATQQSLSLAFLYSANAQI